MWRAAWREIRFHPGRLTATIIAIAISVAFMAGAATLVETQQRAMGKQLNLPVSRADLVLTPLTAENLDPQQMLSRLRALPEVAAAEINPAVQLPLTRPGTSNGALVNLYATPEPALRWAKTTTGEWPKGPGEVALGRDAARKLGVVVGDRLSIGPDSLTVSGITDDPPSLFLATGYLAPDSPIITSSQGPVAIALRPGTSLQAGLAAVRKATGSGQVKVETAAAYADAKLVSSTGDLDLLKYLLMGFGALAAIVGTIIVSNTFTILLAQRRRQLGLLRAVGASTGQVRGQFLAEAVLIGLAGSIIGVLTGLGAATLGAYATGSLYWGLSVPWLNLAQAAALGLVLTVLAGVLPSWRTARIRPLEALQPVATTDQARRASVTRAVICGLLLIGAIATTVSALGATRNAVVLSLAAATLWTFAVLGAAPIFVPWLLRLLGLITRPLGATARLAAANSVRQPRRAAATATALMLTVGLIVTLQVGAATARTTLAEDLVTRYPVDASLQRSDPETPITVDQVARARALPGVSEVSIVRGGTLIDTRTESYWSVLIFDPGLRARYSALPEQLGDGEALVSRQGAKNPFTINGPAGSVTLRPVPSRMLEHDTVMVSAATFATITSAPADPSMLWLKVDHAQAESYAIALEEFRQGNPGLSAGGSMLPATMLNRILTVLLGVATALLGVAIVIALIGVGNTLALSVLERSRESAVLRALGMQRRSLRWMLLAEALLISVAAVAVGVAAGVFFGWLGVTSVLRELPAGQDAPIVRFAVDLPVTAGLVGVALGAGALASVLPGRRAAKAAPAQALATD